MRDASACHRGCRCRCKALARKGAGGAAVAGLRLLRPVRQFRGARTKLSRVRPAPRRSESSAAETGEGGMRITRADRSVFSDWWFTVDRLMFFGLLLLMGAGLVLSLAASPPIAVKYNLEPFYFVRRQAAMLLPAVAIMFAASTLTPKQIRHASLVIFVTGIAMMAVILVTGPEIKGAKRWLELGPFSIQPSEFVKPAFVVLTAWLFNEAQKRRDVPGIQLAVALYAVFTVLLVMQPDFGQTLLVTLVWGAL